MQRILSKVSPLVAEIVAAICMGVAASVLINFEDQPLYASLIGVVVLALGLVTCILAIQNRHRDDQ